MPDISPSELDAFIAFIDDECAGNLRHPQAHQRYQPFALKFESRVDESLSPFGDEYFDAQLGLYREIAGRELDQWSGELHPVDVDSLVDAPNPQGIRNVTHVAENVRALTSMLSFTGLPDGARILDMGAGHGMSSEVYDFCGANVHAIDIDPALGDLATRRATKRSLALQRSLANFDSLASIEAGAYDAAAFFQSLHHALRPWRLIEELKTKLTGDGVIAFCGEPITDERWTHWGLRLDIESTYVARKFGWFESGWSREFITECFAKSGMLLTLFEGGHEGGLIGVATMDERRRQGIVARAAHLGHRVSTPPSANQRKLNFHSQIGMLCVESSFGPFLRSNRFHAGGYLCFGPYVALEAGRYEVSFLLARTAGNGSDASSLVFDIISDAGGQVHHREEIRLAAERPGVLKKLQFTLGSKAAQVEARALVCVADDGWEMSLPVFTRLADAS